MKKIRVIIIFLSTVFMLQSCGAVKEGFSSQKKNNTDEFFVEKKAPLVMPPNFNELPTPNEKNLNENNTGNDLKKLISKSKNDNSSENSNITENNLESSILEKIKK